MPHISQFSYTKGKSEEFLGKMDFLKNPEQKSVLATKVHPIGTAGSKCSIYFKINSMC